MNDSPLNRREILKVGGAGVIGGALATSPTTAQDTNTGVVNEITGFATPQPITNGSEQFQIVTPANRLIIDAATDDSIDLVVEWGDPITIEDSGWALAGSGILTEDDDIGAQRAVFRGDGRGSGDIVYDLLMLRGLDTSAAAPGETVTVEVSARQADSSAATEDFDEVVAAVDDGTFDADATTEATFEVAQGTLISGNDSTTTDLNTGADVEHTVAFDIDQLRDETVGGTPAGPATAIIIDYFIDEGDEFTFDLENEDVTLGGAAADLDLEVVNARELPEIGQVLLETANNDTLENDADLTAGDTITVELTGLDAADVDPDELSDFDSTVEIGLHGPATFEPIVNESITPDRGAYATGRADYEFMNRDEPVPEAGPFTVSELTPTEATVAPGEEVTVSATVTNEGDTDGDTPVVATLDGDDVSTTETILTNLDANDNETTEFTIPAPQDPGEYTHGVRTDDDEATGTLSVEETLDEDGKVTLTVEPSTQQLAAGGTAVFDVGVADAASGVGAYNFTIAVEDLAVATITAATETRDSGSGTGATIAADGGSVTFDRALLGDSFAPGGEITLGSVSVIPSDGANGTTELTLQADEIGDEEGTGYAVDDAATATIEVVDAPDVTGDGNPAGDVTGDGKLDDVNGDGDSDVLDVQALFENLDDDTVRNNPELFDFNSDGDVSILDVQALFNQQA